MKWRDSLRARLMLGAALMLIVFLAGAGWAVQRAHEESVRAARFARLQTIVYLLLAAAEVDAAVALVMPAAFPAPRLSLPGSGLYAGIVNVARRETWRSPSAVGVGRCCARWPPGSGATRSQAPRRDYLAVGTGVSWAGSAGSVPLVLSVFEDKAEFDREIAVFERTSWAWLGGAALLLVLSQTVLLRWCLAPLREATREIRAIEHGEQTTVEGRYPLEVAALTDNLNTLIAQERLRQTRYREALSFLAHSLKTPLAVLRTALSEPAQLPAAVAAQVTRMDDIVQHQLGRAAASGASRFVPALTLAPVLERIRDSLAKVYADKGLVFTLDCAPALPGASTRATRSSCSAT
jgi:two-component system sensor histidine kinase PhoQ